MLRLAAPVICQFVLDKSVQVTAIVMVGHLGPDQLAATSLGASLANVTGNSFLTAFASGLSTLCGQASAQFQDQQLHYSFRTLTPLLTLAELCASSQPWCKQSATCKAIPTRKLCRHMELATMRL